MSYVYYSFMQAPEVCPFYPILLYSVKLTDITNEQDSLEISEIFDNLNSTNDDGFVELIVSGQLISDRRYMVSISAENEVGSHPDVESKDICELYQLKSRLIGS